MSKKKAIVLLAAGFEEIEAVVVIDVLRRAGVDVFMAGVGTGGIAAGAHGVGIEVDGMADDLIVPGCYDLLVLPGGVPGASRLADSGIVLDIVRRMHREHRFVAAICAAPIVLAAAGILTGVRVTCYPGFEDKLADAVCTGAVVECDGNIITGRGPGAAFAFAFRLLTAMGLNDQADVLISGMLLSRQ